MRQQESPVPIVTSLQSEPFVDKVSRTVSSVSVHVSRVRLCCFLVFSFSVFLQVFSVSPKKKHLEAEATVLFGCVVFKRWEKQHGARRVA